MNKPKVLVWLSWWVDSAIAAHLLIQQWYDVIAGFMKNYSESDNPQCTTRIDREIAQQVADFLHIPFMIFDFRKEYQERIIDYIYDGYKQWLTPNPDVFCNNLIKFDLFLKEALKLWCDYIATGHYARVESHKPQATSYTTKETWSLSLTTWSKLYRWLDQNKDQSYFLSRLNHHQLSHALTPLGEYTKPQIRVIAQEIWLPNADRPDSQWLCFIGDIPMYEFLRKKLPEQPWDIIDQTGKKIGTHKGARFYTLGQRHQLFLPLRAYVTAIDVTNNVITVGERYDEKLTSDTVTVTDRVWTGDIQNSGKLKDCLIKIRYRQDPAVPWSCISIDNNNMIFKIKPTRWVAPWQILVAYSHDDQVLGSWIITK